MADRCGRRRWTRDRPRAEVRCTKEVVEWYDAPNYARASKDEPAYIEVDGPGAGHRFRGLRHADGTWGQDSHDFEKTGEVEG